MKSVNPVNMTPVVYPWELDTGSRPIWSCASCGFQSPWWDGAGYRDLCTRCESAARERAREPMRAAIAADRQANARHDGICVGTPKLIHETERACRYEWPDGTEAWIPKSCVLAVSDEGEVFVKAWFHAKELAPRLAKAA